MKKILVIRFSSIGDIILTSPVIRCLKKQLPAAEIHFLSKGQYADILAHNPYITKTHLIKKCVREVIPGLYAENYDYIVDLHKNLRSGNIIRALKVPSGKFSKLNFRKWLLVNFNINILPAVHIVDRYFEAVKELRIENDGLGLDFFIDKDIHLPYDLHNLIEGKQFYAFAIGGKHQTKMLPEEKIIEICSQIKQKIILLGGKEDSEKGEKIQKELSGHVFNYAGKLNLHQSAQVTERSLLLLTHDTGLMHLGAALKKPIISFWGNTVPSFGMYPYYPDDKPSDYKIVQLEGLACRPCSKIGFKECPEGHFNCMRELPIKNLTSLIDLLGLP